MSQSYTLSLCRIWFQTELYKFSNLPVHEFFSCFSLICSIYKPSPSLCKTIIFCRVFPYTDYISIISYHQIFNSVSTIHYFGLIGFIYIYLCLIYLKLQKRWIIQRWWCYYVLLASPWCQYMWCRWRLSAADLTNSSPPECWGRVWVACARTGRTGLRAAVSANATCSAATATMAVVNEMWYYYTDFDRPLHHWTFERKNLLNYNQNFRYISVIMMHSL